jgi:hypothetical protein
MPGKLFWAWFEKKLFWINVAGHTLTPPVLVRIQVPQPIAGWIHQVKQDGYRTLLIIERRKALIFATGHCWNEERS